MLIDVHAHLDQEEFDADRAEVIAAARAAGVAEMICPAVNARSAEHLLQLVEEHGLWAAVGIHPNHVSEAAAGDFERVAALVSHPRVVAVGETGLDRYREHSPFELQVEYFQRHLELSRHSGRPIIIHCRDAQADLLPILREGAAVVPLSGVLHAFSGDWAFAAECLALGLHISFAGNVTYSNRKFEPLREVARLVPDERLLIETDSPYLVPQAFRGRRQRNEPANVRYIAALLAEVRETSVERLAETTAANARRLFRLPM
jgi:TatD DNase family protein